jgi:ABC-2 type transport system permease protein
VALQDALAYRSVALIWMMTDTVPAILMPLVWLASFNGRAAIGGFSPGSMVLYYLLTLLLSNVMVTHIMWDIQRDVAEGRLSVFLTRPFPYVQYCYLGNLAWRLMRLGLFLPIAALFALLFRPYLATVTLDLGPRVWLAVGVGHLLSFAIGYALGMLALFFVETRGIYNFYYMPLVLFSGQLAPLELLPSAVRVAAEWLPWRYTLAFPVEMAMGRLGESAATLGLAVAVGWCLLLAFAGKLLWRVGLRHYTGVGM